jgi:excisionase family DNA binding protein
MSKEKQRVIQVNEYLTAMEVRVWVKLSLPYIRLLTQQKQIPHVRVGRRVLYRAAEIEQWLRSKAIVAAKQESSGAAR